jgi:hypothetical protein
LSLWLSCSKSQKNIPSFIATVYHMTINENDVDYYTAGFMFNYRKEKPTSFIKFRVLPDAPNNS